jgi:alpha/beta superfamily hydrolase
MEAIRNDPEPILIGSSFGGFLAAEAALRCNAIKTIILLNPAIIPPRADARKLRGIPSTIRERMQDSMLFKTKMSVTIVILIATRDEVIPADWVLNFAKTQEATVRFLDDDHAFRDNLSLLPSIIEEVLILRS